MRRGSGRCAHHDEFAARLSLIQVKRRDFTNVFSDVWMRGWCASGQVRRVLSPAFLPRRKNEGIRGRGKYGASREALEPANTNALKFRLSGGAAPSCRHPPAMTG
jgi:hypothetical protein